MAASENSFFGLKVPDGTDRRELYKSQYRGIWTYKMSAGELDESFRTAVTGDGPDGGWTIKNDERVKYVGKLEVAKGEDTTLKVRVAEDAHTSTGWSKRVWGRSRGTDHRGGRGRGEAGDEARQRGTDDFAGGGGAVRHTLTPTRDTCERRLLPRPPLPGHSLPTAQATPHPLARPPAL